MSNSKKGSAYQWTLSPEELEDGICGNDERLEREVKEREQQRLGNSQAASIETEAVGGHFFDTAKSEAAVEISTPLMNQAEAATDILDGYPDWNKFPNLYDQSATVDEQRDENVGCSYSDKVTKRGNCSFDAVTGYALNNDGTASFDWFQMHHDDGIMDGYLDTAENTNGGWMTAEPITEITGFPIGQAITFDESGMDGLVAAGSIGDIDWTSWCFKQQGPCKPLDAMALNEPQNNNVF